MNEISNSESDLVIPLPARRHGFTLIELLVVIVILGILAGLLFPALAKAKRNTRRIQCLNIQKQWALAFRDYVDGNDDWIPREGYDQGGSVWWNNWAHVRDPRSHDVWYNALPGYLSKAPASSYALPSKRLPFYEYPSFFHCPSTSFPKLKGDPGYGIALFSIAMNSQLIEPPNNTIRFAQILKPSQTPLFLDNILEDEEPVVDAQAQDNLGQPAAFANRFAGRRHGQSGVMAFADGGVGSKHGEAVVETNGPNTGWAIVPEKDVIWNPK